MQYMIDHRYVTWLHDAVMYISKVFMYLIILTVLVKGHSIRRRIWTNSGEFNREIRLNFVDLFLTPLNFTEFSGCSPLNSPEFRKIVSV